jgi:hypothetical protein
MHSIEFEPPKMRRVVAVMLGSLLWGVSLGAAQGTQEAPPPEANAPATTLADQTARLAAASVAQTPGQPSGSSSAARARAVPRAVSAGPCFRPPSSM